MDHWLFKKFWIYLYYIHVLCQMAMALTDADVYVLDAAKQNIVHEFPAMSALFGPDIPNHGISGHVVYASPPDACSKVEPPPRNLENQSKWIALVRRNQCNFVQKVLNIQNAGYVAAIVHNIDSDSLLQMRGDSSTGVSIPSVFIGMTSAAILKKYNYSISYTVVIQSANTGYRFLWPFIAVLTICMVAMVLFTMMKCIIARIQKCMTRSPMPNVKTLPTKKYNKGDVYEMCAICLDEYEAGDKLRLLPCHHAFHQKCIDPWLTKSRPTCPLCKKRVFPRSENDDDSESDVASVDNTRVVSSERTPLLAARTSSNLRSSSWDDTMRSLSVSVDTLIDDSEMGSPSHRATSSRSPSSRWRQSNVEVHRVSNIDSDEDEIVSNPQPGVSHGINIDGRLGRDGVDRNTAAADIVDTEHVAGSQLRMSLTSSQIEEAERLMEQSAQRESLWIAPSTGDTTTDTAAVVGTSAALENCSTVAANSGATAGNIPGTAPELAAGRTCTGAAGCHANQVVV